MAEREQVLSGNASRIQSVFLTLLRMAIGWHFLYEGIVKLLEPRWSSAAYLADSKWILSGFFNWVLQNPAALKVVDILNIWGLLLIGLGLFFGCFTRAASLSGIALLLLYYVANPPLIASSPGLHTEGNYLLVDKNLVELLALTVLAFFPAGLSWGLDRLRSGRISPKPAEQIPAEEHEKKIAEAVALPGRREILKNLISLPVFGAFTFALLKRRGWESWEEKHLLAAAGDNPEAITSATLKTFQFSSLKDLKGQLPYAYIGDLKLSRMFLGGNLIGGWAHARDLIYVSTLVKAYHSDQKVFDTFRLAERCGINAILTNPALSRVINEYWRKEQGKIQFISDCAYNHDVLEGIRVSIDGGAHACYVQGGIADRLVEEGNVELIGKGLELIRASKLPAGIGAHKLETVQACVDYGLDPDFWVKTLHRTDYWSATPKDEHDNIWCTDPEATIAYMHNLKKPWIAYKTLAAGAYLPEVGFRYAFENGADFICVGMYDFQIVEDANLALDVLSGQLNRQREWMA